MNVGRLSFLSLQVSKMEKKKPQTPQLAVLPRNHRTPPLSSSGKTLDSYKALTLETPSLNVDKPLLTGKKNKTIT